MTTSEAISIIEKFQEVLHQLQVPIEKMEINTIDLITDKYTTLSHVHWMLNELADEFNQDHLDCDKKEQAFYRLGFVQGILLAFNLCKLRDIATIIAVK